MKYIFKNVKFKTILKSIMNKQTNKQNNRTDNILLVLRGTGNSVYSSAPGLVSTGSADISIRTR